MNESHVDFENELIENQDVVDNEFTGRDIPVSLSWPHSTMKVLNPEV